MFTAITFIVITFAGFLLSVIRGPFWGLLAYANIYFNNPSPNINWWGVYLPNFRWSVLSYGILIVSAVIHRNKLSEHKFSFIYLVFILCIIIQLETITIAVNPIVAQNFAHNMLGYCIIIVILIKTLAKFENVRLFILAIIVFGANLGLNAYLEGKFIEGRVNNVGTADAYGSNEFGILLASIIPLIIPFIFRGKRFERVICFLSIPFLVNGFTLTISRGAFLSLLAGFSYAFFFFTEKKIRKYAFIVIIFFIPVFFYFVDQYYMQRISTLWTEDRSTDKSINELSSGRLDVWKYGIKMVSDYPFGAGPGGFRELSRFYMPAENLTFHRGAEYGVRAAHNTYLLVLVEIGYLGFLLFAIICTATLISLIKSSKKLKEMNQVGNFVHLLIIALNMSIASTLFSGLFSSRFYYEFFWWLIAIVVVVSSLVNQMPINEME